LAPDASLSSSFFKIQATSQESEKWVKWWWKPSWEWRRRRCHDATKKSRGCGLPLSWTIRLVNEDWWINK
jgi:hypothetical protein